VFESVVRLAVAEDCEARGIVTRTVELFIETDCKAEIAISAAVAALPVLVVTCPVIEAGDLFALTSATRGTVLQSDSRPALFHMRRIGQSRPRCANFHLRRYYGISALI
jgi:hypothetical protein